MKPIKNTDDFDTLQKEVEIEIANTHKDIDIIFDLLEDEDVGGTELEEAVDRYILRNSYIIGLLKKQVQMLGGEVDD